MRNPKTSLEIIAPTVEDAVAQGAAQLGTSPDRLEVEILDEGGKGLFGLGSRLARVRLTLRPDESGMPPAPRAEDWIDQPVGDEDQLEAVRVTREIIDELLQRMDIDARVEASWGETHEDGKIRPLQVNIRGSDLSILIGRRGETLAALQYITRLIVGREMRRPIAVVIDVEGYRARRERQLRQLARRMADQAVESGRIAVLEPMPASERRIIHLELRERPDIVTESVGEGVHRKVTIVPRAR
jgi:spoIIIJ-associated protein